jgi:hypothetical protein
MESQLHGDGGFRPRFRDDLVAQPVEEDGVRYVDVTDPNSGSTFRFYDVEYAIACAMDGAKDLAGLAEWTRAELGIETSPDELQSVVSTLADLGYLEAKPTNGAAAGGPAAGSTEIEVAAEMEAEEPPPPAPPDAPVPDFADEHEAPTRVADTRSAEEVVELSADALVEVQSHPEAPPSAGGDDETSFAGINDDEKRAAKPNTVPRKPAPPPAPKPPADEPAPVVIANAGDEDVSVDLSAHVGLGKDEVKEAVRQSKVMMVPEIPKDLIEEMEDNSGGGRVEQSVQLAELSARAQAAMPLPPPPEVVSPPAMDPIPLPSSPPSSRGIEPTPPPPRVTKPKKGTSPVLLFLLFVAVIGGGAVLVWKFVLSTGGESDGVKINARGTGAPDTKTDTKTDQKQPDTKGVQPPDKQPPDKQPPDKQPPDKIPPVASPLKASLVALPAGGTEVTSPSKGKLEFVATRAVKQGELVFALVGGRAKLGELEHNRKRLAHYQNKQNEAKIAEKTELIAQLEPQVKALTAMAPSEGEVEAVKKARDEVEAGDVVVRIGGGKPGLGATFEGDGGGLAAGDVCTIALAADAEKTTACVVDKVEDGKITVKVVEGGGALPVKEGDEVVLQPKKS